MKKILYLFLLLTLVSCASNNKEVLDPNSPHYGKAYFKYNDVDILMIEINGRSWPNTGWNNAGVYIKPSVNQVKFKLHNYDEIFTQCFIAKAGETINLTFYPKGHVKRPSYPFSLFTTLDPISGPILDYVDIPCEKMTTKKINAI